MECGSAILGLLRDSLCDCESVTSKFGKFQGTEHNSYTTLDDNHIIYDTNRFDL